MLINTVLTLQKPKEKIIYGSELFPCLQRLFTKKNLLDEYRTRITAILDQLNAQYDDAQPILDQLYAQQEDVQQESGQQQDDALQEDLEDQQPRTTFRV